MKSVLLLLSLITMTGFAQICNSTGNIVVFSNYDGGTLNINVDMNIPNLKIGIVSYEAVQVNFTGMYVGNITEVIYAGYNNSPNTNCSPSVSTTAFSGLMGGTTTSILFAPPATFSDVDGYDYVICAYSCTSGGMGGCNTPEQVYAYFEDAFSGLIYSHTTQYGCWSGTQNISTGGNCCLALPSPPVADFSVTSDTICVGECIDFTDLSSNAPTSWSWSLSGSSDLTPTVQNPNGICYNTPGTWQAILTATNSSGSDNDTVEIVVLSPNVGTSVTGITISADATSATYQWINCGSGAPVAGATSASFTPDVNGSYAVIVTENGCTDTSMCTSINSIGISDINSDPLIEIYPNPSQGVFNLIDTQGSLLGQPLTITNVLGEIIYSTTVSAAVILVDLSKEPDGIYFVSVNTMNGNLVMSLVKN